MSSLKEHENVMCTDVKCKTDRPQLFYVTRKEVCVEMGRSGQEVAGLIAGYDTAGESSKERTNSFKTPVLVKSLKLGNFQTF